MNKEDQMTEYRRCLWFSRVHSSNCTSVHKPCNLPNFTPHNFFPLFHDSFLYLSFYKWVFLTELSVLMTGQSDYKLKIKMDDDDSLSSLNREETLSNMTFIDCDQDFDSTEIIILWIDGWFDMKYVWFCCGECTRSSILARHDDDDDNGDDADQFNHHHHHHHSSCAPYWSKSWKVFMNEWCK